MNDDVSIFPLEEMMLICRGCGGERKVPSTELVKILSVEDFKAFTSGPIALYVCRCGAKKCDINMTPNAQAREALRRMKEEGYFDEEEG